MKGTAMTLVMGGTLMLASASACDLKISDPLSVANIHASASAWARQVAFSCELSDSCCHGLQDVEHIILEAKGGGPPQGIKGRVKGDFVGTCGRADQVELYNCAPGWRPCLAMYGKDTCQVQTSPGTDGSGHCSLSKGKGKGTFEVDGVSTGCCEAGNNLVTAGQDKHMVTRHVGDYEIHGLEAKEPEFHNAQCGMIGACGKEDQKSIMRFANGMMKGGGPHPAELELLEMFNMTKVAPQQMLAAILISGAEDEVIEDETDVTEVDATEDSSPIVNGILGFVAGAAVTGLGVTVLRRSAPSSEDQYNEIVA